MTKVTEAHLALVKDIYTAILATCGLLITVILALVKAPEPLSLPIRLATGFFLLAAIFSVLALNGIIREKPLLSGSIWLALTTLFLIIGLGCLAVVLSGVLAPSPY